MPLSLGLAHLVPHPPRPPVDDSEPGLPPEAGIKPCASVCMDRSNMATLYANAQWKSLAQAPWPCLCMLQEHASGCGTFSSPRTSRSARASRQNSSPPIGPPRPSGQPSGRAPPTAAKHAPRSGQAQPQGCDPRSVSLLESSVATTQSSFFWNPSSLWCRARGCALEAGDIGQHLSTNGFGLFMHRAVWLRIIA